MPKANTFVAVSILAVGAALLSVPLTRSVVAAGGLQQAYGLSIFPAAIILSIVFLLAHQARGLDRQAEQASREARLTADAQRAEERRQQLSTTLRLSAALNSAVDRNALKQVIESELPVVLGTSDLWVTSRAEGWSLWLGESGLAGDSLLDGLARKPGTWEAVPLVAGTETIGILGVGAHASAGPDRHQHVEAIASLLAVAIRNVELFGRVREQSMVDPMTECLLRHHGLASLSSEMRRARRSGLPLSIVMFDLDNFKEINDRHGHLAGDQALASVGRVLKETLRLSDVRCRYGGEEFLLVLPETSLPGALRAAENLKRQFEGISLPVTGEIVHVTASFGVTEAALADTQATTVLSRADAAMYVAKRTGRNRVETAVASPPTSHARPPQPPGAADPRTGNAGEPA